MMMFRDASRYSFHGLLSVFYIISASNSNALFFMLINVGRHFEIVGRLFAPHCEAYSRLQEERTLSGGDEARQNEGRNLRPSHWSLAEHVSGALPHEVGTMRAWTKRNETVNCYYGVASVHVWTKKRTSCQLLHSGVAFVHVWTHFAMKLSSDHEWNVWKGIQYVCAQVACGAEF